MKLNTIAFENNQVIMTQIIIDGECVVFFQPEIEVVKKANQHTQMELTGTLSQDAYDNVVRGMGFNSSICIKYGEQGRLFTVFCGLVTFVEVLSDLSEYSPSFLVKIKATSYSILLDREKKDVVYEDGNILYQQIVENKLSPYDNTDYILSQELTDFKLEKFTMQYNETDWQFLQRIASRAGCLLSPDSVTEGLKLRCGISLSDTPYFLSTQYSRKIQEVKCIVPPEENDFVGEAKISHYCLLNTEGPDAQTLDIGDCIEDQGAVWYVKEATAIISDHILCHQYQFASHQEFTVTGKYNGRISGLSLPGTVQEVKNNLVKIVMDVDRYPGNNTSWFPYSTFYSTFYCMPEINDRVNLYFPDSEEHHAVIINSVHAPVGATGASAAGAGQEKNYDTQQLFSNDQTKTLATRGGKMLILDDQSGTVSLVCADGSYIAISGNKISINTSLEVSITAGGSINFNANKSINLSAEEKLNLSCAESSISISPDEIGINATDVKMNEG